MQSELTTYLRAGYPGLAITTAEEARAEAEIAAACAAIKRKLSAWSSTDGLVDTSNNRATPCPDPFEALQLLERMFASCSPQHVVLMRDLQLHLDQTDPVFTRRRKDLLHRAKGNGHAIILLGCRHKLPPEPEYEITHIHVVFVDALYRAYAHGREPIANDLRSAIESTGPLPKTMDHRIAQLRQWAQGRAQPASSPENQPAENRRRNRRLEAASN